MNIAKKQIKVIPDKNMTEMMNILIVWSGSELTIKLMRVYSGPNMRAVSVLRTRRVQRRLKQARHL